ncbi:MAG: hypothetical protein GVY05_08980 [Bacteroidetes bacterium]|jgi:hypothetical protein|nr:hypothetical protein [Bacteroidota bacterium]
MVININKKMSKADIKREIEDAITVNRNKRNKEKTEILKKLSGLLSHLKMTPLEIQREMRDGWNE